VAILKTRNEIFEDEEWLSPDMLNRLQRDPPLNPSLPASDWKERGLIFGVIWDGNEYFPRYQFDASYQPLPIISEILEAFGTEADTWDIAAWFHYPNGRITISGPNGFEAVAPKNALDRRQDVLNALERRTATYSA
jgi:hypothetical protein